MKFSPRLKTAAAATAFVLPLGLASSALADDAVPNEGFDTVTITAEILGFITVESQHDIDLGQIPQGTPEFEVHADGTQEGYDGEPAVFEISDGVGGQSDDDDIDDGSVQVSWEISVEFADLVGPDDQTIGIGASGASPFCFFDEDDVCAEPDGLPEDITPGASDFAFELTYDEHRRNVETRVGFQVDVGTAGAGTYSNSEAITLTAEVFANGS